MLLITTNIRAAANEPRLYDFGVDRYAAAAVSGIPADELKRANRDLIRYFNHDEQRTVRIVVTDDSGQEVSLFNPRETAHLSDVKGLFKKVFAIQMGALIYALAFVVTVFLWAKETPLRALATALLRASGLTVAVVALAGLGALVGFDDLWTRFHFLAFTNDLWRLNPASDHLIQMFPQNFWMVATFIIGGFTLLESLILAVVSGLYLHGTRPIAKAPEPAPALPRRPRPGHLTR